MTSRQDKNPARSDETSDAVPEQASEPIIEALNADEATGKAVPLKRRPLKVDGKPLTEIFVPIYLTGELEELSERLGEGSGMASLCAAYCRVHRSIINQMHPDDFNDLQEVVLDFLPRFIREPMERAREEAVRRAMDEQANA